jgi:hypothetical protein
VSNVSVVLRRMRILRCHLIPCRSALARERGVSGKTFVTGRLRSRASALLQWIFAAHTIVGVHAIRRSRLACERGVSGKAFVTARLRSRASALLQGIFAKHSIVGVHAIRRAGLPANAVCQARHSSQADCVRGQARSYRGFWQRMPSSAFNSQRPACWRRRCVRQDIRHRQMRSRASALLHEILVTHTIVGMHAIRRRFLATHAILGVHGIRRSRLAGECGGSETA